jgi:hypothetical protein
VGAARRAGPEVAASDLTRAHAARRSLVERGAHGNVGGFTGRCGAAKVLARSGERERVVSTVVSSREATSSCERPSSALSTRTDRWRSGRRWMSASSARASARSASASGGGAANRGHAVERDVPHWAHARAPELVDARVVDQPQQPRPLLDRHDPRGERRVRPQEHVLEHVVGIVPRAAQQPRGAPPQHGPMPLEDGSKRVLVAQRAGLLGCRGARPHSGRRGARRGVSPFLADRDAPAT